MAGQALFPISGEDARLLEDDSDMDLEEGEGLIPHGRSPAWRRLGPPIVCLLVALILIAVGFWSLHHVPHFQDQPLKNITWDLTLFVLAIACAMACAVLACVSFAFNIVPEETGEMENYVITRPISEGAFGAVYKAYHHHPKTGARTPVALKFCKLGSQEELNSGISEAVHQCGEKHENLVHCKEMFMYKKGASFVNMLFKHDTPYSLCIALDLCSGDVMHELQKWHKDPGSKPSVSTVLEIFKQATRGVDQLHQIKMIHRDLKPENLFISLDKKIIKVGDLGLAEETTRAGAEEGEGDCGTPGYMAPEVHTEQLYSDKADQWSMGCILFDMMRPTEEGQWSLTDYVADELESRGTPCAEMREEMDIWHGFGEHGQDNYEEAIGIASEASEISSNATVKKAFAQCMKYDPHQRCSAKQLLQILG